MSDRPVGPIPVEGEAPEQYLARNDAFTSGRYVDDHRDHWSSVPDEELSAYVADRYARAAPLGTAAEIKAAMPEGKLRAEIKLLTGDLAAAEERCMYWRGRAQAAETVYGPLIPEALGLHKAIDALEDTGRLKLWAQAEADDQPVDLDTCEILIRYLKALAGDET